MPSFRRSCLPLLIAFALLGCEGTIEPDPVLDEEITRTVSDPVGDVFGTGTTHWDVTGLTITRDPAGITVQLDFSIDVISPLGGSATAMIGFVDFDVDQDPATGITATVDEYRPNDGDSGIGVDYELALTSYAANGSVAVTDSNLREVGRVTPVFSGRRVTIRIPAALIGNDDGFLNAAAIVGAGNVPTDIVPENGHLKVER